MVAAKKSVKSRSGGRKGGKTGVRAKGYYGGRCNETQRKVKGRGNDGLCHFLRAVSADPGKEERK